MDRTNAAAAVLTQEQMMMENEAAALAAEMFDHFCSATTIRQILGLYRNMCDTIGLRPGPLNEFYPKLKHKIKNWKAQALWKKFDARASHRVYNKGTACNGMRVFVIGAGPCGLRTAIEAQLLGAKVVVVEKRDRISRNNVLHLWPFLITDLRNLGAKKFYGKFCAGAIDHISIRQLQCILLKVALLLGVEIHEGISFEETIPPTDGCGWRARVSPEDHAVSHYEFDVLIGADGKRNTLEGFRRKEFRGKLAIAITANFINKKTEAEARVEEISGVAFIFNQGFFKDLYQTTGIDLENIVYYKDDTHYFVMTAKKHSLLDKGVIMHDYADPAELLNSSNVNTARLYDYAKEAADYATKYQLPNLEFAVNHYGKPDVAMFDFTSMFAAENSSRIAVRKNYRLLQCLVGDSLLEPFWPTGSGCARGFLSSMDAAYAIKLFSNSKNSSLGVMAQRESIYRLLAQTTPENLHRDIGSYTIEPSTRYPNLNRTAVTPIQVKNYLDTDDPAVYEQIFMDTTALTALAIDEPIRRKRRTADTIPLGVVLLRWIKSQLKIYEFCGTLTEESQIFTQGQVLVHLIHRYRPDLIDLTDLAGKTPQELNDHAFNILENDLAIPRVMTAAESVNLDKVDSKIWLNYLEQICEVFRGEIPHVKHPKLDFNELRDKPRNVPSSMADFSRLYKKYSTGVKKLEATTTQQQPAAAPIAANRRPSRDEEHHRIRRPRKLTETKVDPVAGQNDTPRRAKKRRSYDKNIEERTKRLQEIEENRFDRQSKRREQRRRQTENFLTSLHMLQANQFLRESDSSTPFEDYSLFVYRQSAPIFNDRVKDLEQKLLYPDRERGIPSALPRGGLDDQFSDRIKSMEQRITGKHGGFTEKKPKDLLRAIGKIESNDWNVKEIEKKIEASKKTEVGKSREKVPKWSREQFLARQNKMSRPIDKEAGDEKYREIDTTIKALDKQLKDPVLLERGKNKVAAIAGQFVKKDAVDATASTASDEKSSHQKPNQTKAAPVFSSHTASDICHFCKQRVYLMEKVTAESLILHRSCLKCHHCHTNLRLGGYAFDRDNPHGLFYCTQHYRLPAKAKPTPKRLMPRPSTTHKTAQDASRKPDMPSILSDAAKSELSKMDVFNRGQTPERIEFENVDISDGEPSLEHVIDENEWTDRNFGTGTDASESDITSSTSESEDSDSDIFEEAMGSPLGAQTLQLATDWIGKQRYIQDSDENDFYDTSEDDEADTQTEGEELAKARELRMQEVKLRPPLCAQMTDTETEAASDTDSSSPDVELNSATEISTDSEFDLDPISKNPPQIYIDDSFVKKPTRVHIKQGMIGNGFSNNRFNVVESIANKKPIDKDIHLKFKPLVQVDPSVLNSNIAPLKNPRPGDYILNKTPSTEGIASKKSLELKKRYLLGDPNLTGGIMKSGSTSILDSKLRNFHSNISECQKLLNPGAAISPTMQSFLQKTNKIGESKNNNVDEKENIRNDENNKLTETVNTALIEHNIRNKPIEIIDLTISPEVKTKPIIDTINIPDTVIKKNQEFIENMEKSDIIDLTVDTPVKDRSLEEQNENFSAVVPDIIKSSNLMERTKNTIDQMFEENVNSTDKLENCEDVNDQRARSPAHETSIQVPTRISWEKNSIKNNIESDSLSSSSSTSSLDEIPHYILDSATSPETQGGAAGDNKFIPRVEVRDSAGELMQIDSLMIVNGKYVGDPDDLKLCEKLPEGTVVDETTTTSSALSQSTSTPPTSTTPTTPTPVILIKKREDKLLKKDEDRNDDDTKCDTNNKTSCLDSILKYDYNKPDLKFDTKNENKLDTLRNLPLIIPKEKKPPMQLKFAETSDDKRYSSDVDKTPTVANPEPTIQQKHLEEVSSKFLANSDSETEITGQGMTETELSDWTADDAVSENFVDIEFALNSNKGTIKRNKKHKTKKRATFVASNNTQAKTGDYISGGGDSGKFLDFDNIEFMDTGSEDSCIETYSTVNKAMLRNRGYVEFVDHHDDVKDYMQYKPDPGYAKDSASPKYQQPNNRTQMVEAVNKDLPKIDFIEQGACILSSDFDLKTPINEVPQMLGGKHHNGHPTDMEEDSLLMIASQTTTTTEDSDALTVVTSPLDSFPEKFDAFSSDSTKTEEKKIEIEKLLEKTINNNIADHKDINKTPEDMSYEEYVRQLQTQIREISSARDSLDMRKSRRKSSKGDDISAPISQINTATTSPSKSLSIFQISPSAPTVTKKLEEITKERTKQKDLIHDLVMDKLQTKKQLNAEKRLNRSRNRNNVIFSAMHVSHNPHGNETCDLHPVAPDRRNSKSKETSAERRHSLNVSPADSKETTMRPLSAHVGIVATPKITKTQSFCISNTTNYRSPFSEFRTPIAPPRTKNADPVTDKIRSEARERARLKSNEDLGLSPEDKIQLLRKRYHLDMMQVNKVPDPMKNKSDDMKFRERRLISSKSVNDITTVHQLASELRKSYIGTTSSPLSTPQTPKYNKNFEFSTSEYDLKKSQKDRRGLIQTVSDFFYKKKDSKDSSPTKDNKDAADVKVRFGLFRMSPRSKSKSFSDMRTLGDGEKETNISPNERSKSENSIKHDKQSATTSSSPDKFDDVAPPPIPPLPLNYQRSDDENYSFNDSRESRKCRSLSKASRQAELKRLRIAQEIQREQEEIEVKIKELEASGVALEKALRGEGQDFELSDSKNDENFVKDLLEIWRNITDLRKRDEELEIRQKELQLEHRHAQLKEELNVRLSCNKLDKSSSDIAAEGAILNEMLEIVAKRAALRPADSIGTTDTNHDTDI